MINLFIQNFTPFLFFNVRLSILKSIKEKGGRLKLYTASPHHTNIQVVNFQNEKVHSINSRSEWKCSMSSIFCCCWSIRSVVSHLLSILKAVLSCLFTRGLPLYTSCCIYALLYFSSYCTVRLKKLSSFLYLFLFMYYWRDKYYKPITVKNYIAHCVNWVPRPTLWDLTNWTYKHALRDRRHVYVRDSL